MPKAALRSTASDFSVPSSWIIFRIFAVNANLLYWERRQRQPRRIRERRMEGTGDATTRYGGQHPTHGAHALPAALIDALAARLDSCGWRILANPGCCCATRGPLKPASWRAGKVAPHALLSAYTLLYDGCASFCFFGSTS